MRSFAPSAVVLAAIILAATAAWLGRYETTAASAGGSVAVAVTDRWTGTTQVCAAGAGPYPGSICVRVYPPAYSFGGPPSSSNPPP